MRTLLFLKKKWYLDDYYKCSEQGTLVELNIILGAGTRFTENNMIVTCGSDFHHYGQECLCGIITKEELRDSYDVANVLKAGDYNMAVGNYLISI